MALYMVYAWEKDDVEAREWIVDLTWKEAEAIDSRLQNLLRATIADDNNDPYLRDAGVALLEHSKDAWSNMEDFITDLEKEFEIAPAVHAGG